MFGRNLHQERLRDQERQSKIAESQRILLEAAISTADAAQEVTKKLKRRLDDIMIQFEQTASILKDALIICNMDGDIEVFNPAAERVFGMAASNATKVTLANFFKLNVELATIGDLWEALKNDQRNVLGLRGDETFEIETTFSVLDRFDGTSSVLLLVRDVSESQQNYKALLETSFDGVVIINKEDGLISAANSAMTALFGYTSDEVVGKSLSELMTGLVWIQSAMENKGQQSCFAGEGVVRQSGKKKSLLFAVANIRWNGKESLLATIKDVSIMQNLSGASTRNVNEIDMICCYDTGFLITFANNAYADFYQAKRGDLLGTDIRNVMTRSERDAFMQSFARLDHDTPSIRSHVRSFRNDQNTFQDWVDHVTFDDLGNPAEYQRIGRDIAGLIALAHD